MPPYSGGLRPEEWREADYEGTDLETVIQDMLSGQPPSAAESALMIQLRRLLHREIGRAASSALVLSGRRFVRYFLCQ
jgi:hypothetical protein